MLIDIIKKLVVDLNAKDWFAVARGVGQLWISAVELIDQFRGGAVQTSSQEDLTELPACIAELETAYASSTAVSSKGPPVELRSHAGQPVSFSPMMIIATVKGVIDLLKLLKNLRD